MKKVYMNVKLVVKKVDKDIHKNLKMSFGCLLSILSENQDSKYLQLNFFAHYL